MHKTIPYYWDLKARSENIPCTTAMRCYTLKVLDRLSYRSQPGSRFTPNNVTISTLAYPAVRNVFAVKVSL